MFVIYLMSNLKTIFTTTFISILFGVYSIYNLIEYVEETNKLNETKINKLNERLVETNDKYMELKSNYKHMKKCNEDLLFRLNDLTNVISDLNRELMMLKETNNKVTTDVDEKIPSDEVSNLKVPICDDLCELRSSIKNHIVETMSEPPTPANSFVSSRSHSLIGLDDYDYEYETIEKEKERAYPEQKVSDINWIGLTRKMFLGF